MLSFLNGIPGKLKALNDRLSGTWAAKLDALRTGLTDARMGYLDKLNITGSVASTTDLSGLASASNPILDTPISSGIQATPYVSASGGWMPIAEDSHTTTSSTYVNALSYTGVGVLELAIHYASGSGTSSVEIVLDGVTCLSTSTSTAGQFTAPVGALGWNTDFSGNRQVYPIACGHVPFASSCVIRHKNSSSAQSIVYYRLRKTS